MLSRCGQVFWNAGASVAAENSGTLANGVLYHLLERGEASGVHPVTRLDRDTFGVVI